MSFKNIVAIVLLLLFVTIVFQNSGVVSIQFLFWKLSMSGILLYPLIFAFGFITGWVPGLLFKKSP